MKDHPLESILTKLEVQTIKSFKKALKEIKPEHLTGFGLYSDESGSTISIAVNSIHHLEKRIHKQTQFSNDWHFAIPEWHSEDYNPRLVTINNALSDYMDTEEVQNAFPKHRDAFFNACIIILSEVKKLIPENINPDFILVFEASEYDNKKAELAWFKKLNAARLYKKFEAWRKTF